MFLVFSVNLSHKKIQKRNRDSGSHLLNHRYDKKVDDSHHILHIIKLKPALGTLANMRKLQKG